MDDEKAMELLANYFNWCPDCTKSKRIACDDCMVQATERAICALEKQIYKSPKIHIKDGGYVDYCECAGCGAIVEIGQSYCEICGQRQDWD